MYEREFYHLQEENAIKELKPSYVYFQVQRTLASFPQINGRTRILLTFMRLNEYSVNGNYDKIIYLLKYDTRRYRILICNNV